MLTWAGQELNFITVAGMGLLWICAGISVGNSGMFSVLVSRACMVSRPLLLSYDPTGRSLGSRRVWERTWLVGLAQLPTGMSHTPQCRNLGLLLRNWLHVSWLVVRECFHLHNLSFLGLILLVLFFFFSLQFIIFISFQLFRSSYLNPGVFLLLPY